MNSIGMQKIELNKKFKNFINNYPMLLIAILTIILFSVFVPKFMTVQNIENIILQSTTLMVLALGIAPILIIGGIDLSLAALMGLSSIVGAYYLVKTGNIFISILIMLAISILGGAFNGSVIAWFKMVPFVTTLSIMIVVTGFSTWITKAGSIGGLPAKFSLIYEGNIWFIPIPIIIVLILGIIYYLVFEKSFIGRIIYACGNNLLASRISGIKVNVVMFTVYVFGGLCAGITAILMTSRMRVAAPSLAGESLMLDYISAAVIGGVSFYGGKGHVVGAMLGAIFMTAINNVLNIAGLGFAYVLIIKGLILIIIISFEKLKLKL